MAARFGRRKFLGGAALMLLAPGQALGARHGGALSAVQALEAGQLK